MAVSTCIYRKLIPENFPALGHEETVTRLLNIINAIYPTHVRTYRVVPVCASNGITTGSTGASAALAGVSGPPAGGRASPPHLPGNPLTQAAVSFCAGRRLDPLGECVAFLETI